MISSDVEKLYNQLFSDPSLKVEIEAKAKKISTKEELKKFIDTEIIPIMKEKNLIFEEEKIKNLSEDDLENVSGGISLKSALVSSGILSMALFGSLGNQVSKTASAMPFQNSVQLPQEKSDDVKENYSSLMETLYLSKDPEYKKSLIIGLKTPIDQCVDEDDIEW